MIGLNSVISRNNYITGRNVSYRSQNFGADSAEMILKKGDKAYNENRMDEAVKYYSDAKILEPDKAVICRKLGKCYSHLKQYEKAEAEYNEYLKQVPDNIDAIIEAGQVQRSNGKYLMAINTFKRALSAEPGNDLAKRCKLEAENDMLAVFYPQRALNEKNMQAYKTLSEALSMTVQYMGEKYMKHLADVQIKFGNTASMNGTANIAQYENYKKTITVSNSYVYASPQVIAAYLVHESVHARDKDAYTSIREEQDAYETATKFWINNSNGVNDPEMDYAADLYKQSPEKLKSRVAEIYRLRDPEIAETSPNHPPHKFFNKNLQMRKTASQTLKEYGTIA